MTEVIKESRLDAWLDEHAKDEALCTAIKDAVTKYGEDEVEVLRLSKPVGAVAIFHTPNGAAYKRFTSQILNDKPETKAVAAEVLARSCVVYPDKQIFASWCDRYGGIGAAVLKPLTKLAGSELADRGKE